MAKGKLFVAVFANSSCTQDKFVVIAKPGLTPLPAINFRHHDKLLHQDNLYRDTAPVPIYKLSATKTTNQPLSKLVPRPRHYPIKFAP